MSTTPTPANDVESRKASIAEKRRLLRELESEREAAARDASASVAIEELAVEEDRLDSQIAEARAAIERQRGNKEPEVQPVTPAPPAPAPKPEPVADKKN